MHTEIRMRKCFMGSPEFMAVWVDCVALAWADRDKVKHFIEPVVPVLNFQIERVLFDERDHHITFELFGFRLYYRGYCRSGTKRFLDLNSVSALQPARRRENSRPT